jgi:drug/metabolite transporter (DMT)-like permease
MQRRGALSGLLAAALFGLSAPLCKRLLSEVTPLVLAGLLYLGAAVGLSVYRRLWPSAGEARLQKSDVPTLGAVIALGGVLGPVLMLVGLSRVTALSGSLLLNLEAPATILVAALAFREHLGRVVLLASMLIVGGAALLKLQAGQAGADLWGMACIAAACVSWAFDNNLTQRLTLRDPFAVVRYKASFAGVFNLALGLALGGKLPPAPVIGAAMLLGSLSYGASVVLDAYALRLVGAAREAAYFATAPFVGALAAAGFLGERLGASDGMAMVLMAMGVALLLRERHGHPHAHESMEHSHGHVHDEHHQHDHASSDPPGEPHAHHHRHAPLVHDHPHVPDAHHRHDH